MISEIHSNAARENGSKSRGPTTPEGKAISSRNRYTHGMLSKSIVIEGEETARFSALLQSLRAAIQPRNFLEEGLVEDLAICRWRQRRLLAMETANMTREIRRQDPALNTEPPAVRAAFAINTLASESRALDLINRYEHRIDRQYNRILHRLDKMRNHSNPATD